jgi:hypothetical protein
MCIMQGLASKFQRMMNRSRLRSREGMDQQIMKKSICRVIFDSRTSWGDGGSLPGTGALGMTTRGIATWRLAKVEIHWWSHPMRYIIELFHYISVWNEISAIFDFACTTSPDNQRKCILQIIIHPSEWSFNVDFEIRASEVVALRFPLQFHHPPKRIVELYNASRVTDSSYSGRWSLGLLSLCWNTYHLLCALVILTQIIKSTYLKPTIPATHHRARSRVATTSNTPDAIETIFKKLAQPPQLFERTQFSWAYNRKIKGERLQLIEHKPKESKVYEEMESSFRYQLMNHRERDITRRLVSRRHHFHGPAIAS